MNAFLARDRLALITAPAVLGPLLERMAQRLAPELWQPNLIDDVVSTTFVHLLAPAVRTFDPSRGTATQFLHGFVLRAVQQVRSEQGGAGIKKEDLRRRLRRDPLLDSDDLEHLRAARRLVVSDPMAEVDALIDLERSLPTDPPLRRAVLMIAIDDYTTAAVAREVGWERTLLRRRLREWGEVALPATG